MTEHRPQTGGSFIRNKDGSLKRIGGTAPAKTPAEEAALAKAETPAAPQLAAPSHTETPKKGK